MRRFFFLTMAFEPYYPHAGLYEGCAPVPRLLSWTGSRERWGHVYARRGRTREEPSWGLGMMSSVMDRRGE